MVVEVVVDAGVRRRGHDQIDGLRIDVGEPARVGVGDEGARCARGDTLAEGDEALGELAGFVDEELDRKTGREAARCFAARRVALREGEFREEGGDDEAKRSLWLVVLEGEYAVMDAIELEQDMDRVALPIFGVVALVGVGAVEAALLRLVGDALGGSDEVACKLFRDPARLEPGELYREGVQVGAERGAAEGPRLDDDGPATTEGVKHTTVAARETFDEPTCGLRVEAGRVAMEPVHILHDLVFVGAHVESVDEGRLLLLAPALNAHLAADVTEGASLASRLEGRFVPFLCSLAGASDGARGVFLCSWAGASDGTRGGRLRGRQGSSISAGGGLFLAGPKGPLA